MSAGVTWAPATRVPLHRGPRPIADPEDLARLTPGETSDAAELSEAGLIVLSPSLVAAGDRGLGPDALAAWVASPGATVHRIVLGLLAGSLCAHGGDQIAGLVRRSAAVDAVRAAWGEARAASLLGLAPGDGGLLVLAMTPRVVMAYGYVGRVLAARVQFSAQRAVSGA
jgi:hypothetical protein